MPQLIRFITLPLGCSLLWAYAAPETKSPVETPGRPESAKTRMLEAGAATLQAKPPIEANQRIPGWLPPLKRTS